MITIDAGRLLADLRALAGFGKCGTGVDRPAFGVPDTAARCWLRDRMADAGLAPVIDSVGNVYGRDPRAERAVLVGSHSDSVPKGGWLDGALGVIYGIEIARSVRAAEIAGRAGVDVISFQEEEGAYLPFLGSRSYCDEVTAAEIDCAIGADGRILRAAIAESGMCGPQPARLDPARHLAYLEGHIEQGPRLEAAGRRIGVVTALVGVRRFRLSFAGRADHAGTTPINQRRDAGAALIRLAHRLIDMFGREGGADTVWNMGKAVFEPGAPNVVPARAELVVEFRDSAGERLDHLERRLTAMIAEADGAHGVAVSAADIGRVAPARMDPVLQDAIRAAARAHDAPWVDLPSGAGHDAMILARHVPAGMLFIPSIGGRSHDVAENTSDDDIVVGCRVLADAVATVIIKENGA